MPRTVYLVIWSSILLLVAGCSLLDDDSSTGDPAAGDPVAATGAIIITMETEPAGQTGSFTVTGVPSGTLSVGGTLVVGDLEPGTYTTTEVDPAPDFDVTAVRCDDGDQGTASSGDPQTRTAVINLDASETVTCTFTNTQRGSLVIAGRTEPDGAAGQVRYTGVPSGTIPANDGTLVVANLQPGTYTSTQVDPAPEFDLTAVDCDDGASATTSAGDPGTRSAIFNLDPGEMVTCTFVNTRRATAVVAAAVEPAGPESSFLFTGVPSGTISAGGTLVVEGLVPGTYTTTEADPAPDFELAAVECDDGASATTSAGDPGTRSAIFNLDPGETVTCTFLNAATASAPETAGGSGGTGPAGGDSPPDANGTNPFASPDPDFDQFPLPDDLPPGAGTYLVPRPGPWTATNFAGSMDCSAMSMAIPAEPPEPGEIQVLDGGATVIASGVSGSAGVDITMNADPALAGRYSGSFQATEQGVPITIDYYWQLVTDEYIVGYLTSTFSAEGVSCSIYRPFELRYAG